MSQSCIIKIRPSNPALQTQLEQSGANPLLARLYAARNVASARELQDNLTELLPYTQLKNCEAAANNLANAIMQNQAIMVVADYDADGATACTVAIKGLSSMGAHVDFLVPNRFEDGYGLSAKLAETAAQQGAHILLTVDNGIASIEGVARAQELGMKVIVTDHHLPAEQLPDCLIVNPNQKDCTFPSKNLAGVGVIFYVLMALRAELRQRNWFSGSLKEPNLAELLDLVALGTIADVVPLDHNNRILVSQGLKRIRAGKMCHGIRALFEIARRDPRKAQPFDMGFAIGPRINAAGRLDDMSLGIACLLSGSLETAQEIATDLNTLNQTRQEIEHGMLHNILATFPERLPENQTTVVVYRDDFHQGVVGIVASRLKDKFYRPTIVFAQADAGELRGSGRSITGLHLRDVLDLIAKRFPNLIIKFGGHAMAAGLTILAENLHAFQAAFEQMVAELVDENTLSQTLLTDGSLPANEINLANATFLAQQVWGQGFPQPTFSDEFQVVRQQKMGSTGLHTKAWLRKENHEFEAMFWRCQEQLPEKIRTVYRPTVNEWKGNHELQLYVDYWEQVS
ncbi:MAG: single-stranded-DNA-specific exonuclease RecJ [Alysiella sp.]|uniref:single-stranded-DNA-specific exonuclease RecJ n=1 Tax=Alysiella sp. TaxID=1872483 RepID=UPI0026DAEF96|nr:single-stranded-DNA-specific exonuclease RecJ [Alysiella sp.]MDO4434771.1 single-stranded-DNA-specific exonuclease RecJ [Alysiella sp.]